MFFTTYYIKKSDGTIIKNIFAYDTYKEAINKHVEITVNYQYVPSDYFRCFILNDEGECLSNNLDN